jgi:Glycosyltransferase family 87
MRLSINSRSWITAKRLRAHGTILLLCLWSLYVWNLSTPGLRDHNGNLKGTDFLHFYTLGSIALAHRGADLYDMSAQAVLAAQRVPEATGIRYLPMYPPQVSLLFAPFAYLSYGWALTLWWSCSAIIYGTCCYALWLACPNLREYRSLVALLAVASPAFFHLIAWGQTSALALACFTLMFFFLRSQREFLAGLVLGCLIFKPQLGLAAAIVFASIGAWRVLLGAGLSATVQLGTGVLYYGIEPTRKWISTLLHVRELFPLLEPKLYQTHSLRTFWDMIIPWGGLSFALYLASSLLVLGLTIACWKRASPAPLALRYSSLLLATVLIAPHLTVYDLVILAPMFILLADWLIAQPPSAATNQAGILLYLVYMLPLIGPFARWAHLQLSVIAMGLLVYMIWKMAHDSGTISAPGTISASARETLSPSTSRARKNTYPNRNDNASGNRRAQADS